MKSSIGIKKLAPGLIFLVLYVGLSFNLSAQETLKLPRSTPEQEGVSSAGIIDFLNAADTSKAELHSFMFIRHGKVIAEGWWSPYGSNYKHIMFSASKTFTATAIGLAASEGRLKLTDKVISFFPYSMPDSVGAYMKELTIGHLLTMSVGQDPTSMGYGQNDDWIREFLKMEPVYKPGTVFKYNNMATFMLSAIIQQATGQTVLDYLKLRIFEPLAIRGIDWDSNLQGINIGAAGLRLRTEDMAKFGQLLLQKGMWNKKQLIPNGWVDEATSFKIESDDPGNKRPKNLNDWKWGYCYQMWRGRNNTVRLDGAAGQFVVLIPDKDAVVVMTGGTRFSQLELDLMHDYLIPAIKSEKPFPENPETQNKLVQKESELIIEPPFKVIEKSDLESRISGKEFVLSDKEFDIQSVYFSFENEVCNLSVKKNNNLSSFKAGLKKWELVNTDLDYFLLPPKLWPLRWVDANYSVPKSFTKVGATYSWVKNSTLKISVRVIEESVASRLLTCTFNEFNGNIYLNFQQEVLGMGMPGEPQQGVPIRGTLVEVK